MRYKSLRNDEYTVYLPYQNLLNKFGVPVRYSDYYESQYTYLLMFGQVSGKKIILDNTARVSHYLHELAHFVDHLLDIGFREGPDDNEWKYIYSSDYGACGRYIRTDDEIVANKVSKLLCVKLGIKLNYEDKNRGKRKAPKRLIKRINAIVKFIEEWSEE